MSAAAGDGKKIRQLSGRLLKLWIPPQIILDPPQHPTGIDLTGWSVVSFLTLRQRQSAGTEILFNDYRNSQSQKSTVRLYDGSHFKNFYSAIPLTNGKHCSFLR
jgi:hypothetical protein